MIPDLHPPSHIQLHPNPSQNPAYFPIYFHNIRVLIWPYPSNFSLLFQHSPQPIVTLIIRCYGLVDWLPTTYSIPSAQRDNPPITHLFHALSNKGSTKKRPLTFPRLFQQRKHKETTLTFLHLFQQRKHKGTNLSFSIFFNKGSTKEAQRNDRVLVLPLQC